MRAGKGMWEEAYFFLDFFVSFLCQDKNESPSGKTKVRDKIKVNSVIN